MAHIFLNNNRQELKSFAVNIDFTYLVLQGIKCTAQCYLIPVHYHTIINFCYCPVLTLRIYTYKSAYLGCINPRNCPKLKLCIEYKVMPKYYECNCILYLSL